MRFSIIIPSFLGEYRTAARDRDRKIIRAINSVLSQTFQDFEVLVIADGCDKTVELMRQIDDLRVSTYLIPKSKTWSGEPRNTGLEKASGDYILYLDIDDLFGENHLKSVSDQLSGFDWVWFNDVRYTSKTGEWYENPCDINIISRHGTSNICHKRSMNVRWTHTGYAHDYYFIQSLKISRNYTKIQNCEYYVCHVPNVGGYDL